jgi:hypothetical protein
MARVTAPGGKVAIWWKTMLSEEPLRDVRNRAAAAIGASPPPDIMTGSFRAFYRHPFKERWVRVVPHIIMTTTDRWLGYERSRARLNHYGDKAQEYLVALEREMRDIDKGKPFHVRYAQFVYVAQV